MVAAEILTGLGGLKTALDIAKGFKDITDVTARNAAAIELQEKLLRAYEAHTTLLQEVSELEKEVAHLKAWDADKERYQLSEISAGVYAYTLKPGMERGEPPHILCANCYQRGEKSLFQATQELRMRRRVHVCHRCNAEIETTYVSRPEPPPVNRGPPGGTWGASRTG